MSVPRFVPTPLPRLAVALFVGYIVSNPINSCYAIAFLVVSYPVYRSVRRLSVA